MTNECQIEIKEVTLPAIITIPDAARGMVLFAHGSGSSRHSPRNQHVAQSLNAKGMATCLFDLLTPEEEVIDSQSAEYRFNINLLAKRLAEVTAWISSTYAGAKFSIGYFGSSTGAAAALIASTLARTPIAAIVSRGGRPDLAGDVLEKVTAPTLLLVGQRDEQVIPLNQLAFNRLTGEKELVLIPKATHLFEEPGTLEEVIYFTARWFQLYFSEIK